MQRIQGGIGFLQSLRILRLLEALLDHWSPYQSGQNTVDPNRRSILQGDALGQHNHTGLGRTVPDTLRNRTHAQIRTDGDNGSIRLLLQLRNRSLAHVKHAAQIDGQLTHKGFAVRGFQRTDKGNAGAAHQLIHFAKGLYRLGDHIFSLVKFGQVCLNVNSAAVLDFHLRFDSAANDLSAFLQKHLSHAFADPGACAGNDDNFILKFHCDASFPAITVKISILFRCAQNGCSDAVQSFPRSGCSESAYRDA